MLLSADEAIGSVQTFALVAWADGEAKLVTENAGDLLLLLGGKWFDGLGEDRLERCLLYTSRCV